MNRIHRWPERAVPASRFVCRLDRAMVALTPSRNSNCTLFVEEVLAGSELVVVSNRTEAFAGVGAMLKPGQVLVDLPTRWIGAR